MRTLAFSTLVWMMIGTHSCAQSTTDYHPTMTFDVASIRESKPGNEFLVTGSLPLHESTFRAQNNSIANLVTLAYGIKHYQLEGLPSWQGETLYTIQARSDDAADAKLVHLSDHDARLERQHMLQVLLAERFHLQVHWETRQQPALDLVVSKPGLLKDAVSTPADAEEDKNKKLPPLYQRGSSTSGFELVAHGASMKLLRTMLEGQFGRTVVDKTGLSGTYDFVLPYLGGLESDRKSDDMSSVPTLERSLQDTLGLRVKPSRGDVAVVVIDHVEQHPPEN